MKPTVTALARLSPQAKRALLTRLLRKQAGKTPLNIDRLAVNVAALDGEATLDASIDPEGVPFEPRSEPRHILLTGATGFLGAFLLRELLERTEADIHCLVRAGSADEGRTRLRQTLQSVLALATGFQCADRCCPGRPRDACARPINAVGGGPGKHDRCDLSQRRVRELDLPIRTTEGS